MTKTTWADIKAIVNGLPENILKQPATIWTEAEDTGHCVTGIKILDEDHHYDGDSGCAPLSVIKENDDDFEENKDEYHLVHAVGTPILLIPENVL
jgi:hypothetical protein